MCVFQTVTIPNAYEDPRFDPSVDDNGTFKHKSILCMAIKNSLGQIIGVIQLINKFDDLVSFSSFLIAWSLLNHLLTLGVHEKRWKLRRSICDFLWNGNSQYPHVRESDCCHGKAKRHTWSSQLSCVGIDRWCCSTDGKHKFYDDDLRHIVISRFPIISDSKFRHQHIFNFMTSPLMTWTWMTTALSKLVSGCSSTLTSSNVSTSTTRCSVGGFWASRKTIDTWLITIGAMRSMSLRWCSLF